MDKLYIVIPAYNEAENIAACVRDWYPIVERYGGEGSRLVVIDDGSKDETFSILSAFAKDRPLLLPLTKENGGHGSAVLYGYRYAIENGADFIFQTDADGQTDPNEFEAFWRERNHYDAVIGSRTKRGDGAVRAFVERVVCLLVRVYFGVKVPDANAPFRLMRTALVKKYIGRMPEDFYIPNIMLTACFARCRESLQFLPVSFRPRRNGENSINIKKIVKIGWRAIGDFRKLRKGISG
ncbi:MAG: glycosyltransferase family 2 protein [Clostridia bacterium]|nr:glycosyltransferase family 2 protein [Clostridia bacterium]